ncbi:hypothetical protein SB48_HM08orf06286 [Heyndrickxia coagulans]|uniref:Uncharacterized protein n=1 Tax=Heyndrickxia coagulans TaxID=1398 RepID=A0AAN0T8C5_HEYCO|nr:hypothetical protein SB48_HM08orf06286 [Heyndrickxia coagulans]
MQGTDFLTGRYKASSKEAGPIKSPCFTLYHPFNQSFD